MVVGENIKKNHGLNEGRFLFRENAVLLKKNAKNHYAPFFDDSQNAGENKGAPTECAFIASSAL